MKKSLIVIRHADSPEQAPESHPAGNTGTSELTEAGTAQAQQLGRRLRADSERQLGGRIIREAAHPVTVLSFLDEGAIAGAIAEKAFRHQNGIPQPPSQAK